MWLNYIGNHKSRASVLNFCFSLQWQKSCGNEAKSPSSLVVKKKWWKNLLPIKTRRPFHYIRYTAQWLEKFQKCLIFIVNPKELENTKNCFLKLATLKPKGLGGNFGKWDIFLVILNHCGMIQCLNYISWSWVQASRVTHYWGNSRFLMDNPNIQTWMCHFWWSVVF